MGGSNLAFEMPDTKPEEEFYGPAQREELSLMRIELMNMKEGKFEGAKLERYKKLLAMEEAALKGGKRLSAEEVEEHRQLGNLKKLTPEQSARLAKLQSDFDQYGREAVRDPVKELTFPE